MAEERETRQTVPDANGAHWVHVSAEEVRAHPKGRPGLVLWAIAAWFAASGALEMALVQAAGAPVWSGVLGLLSLLTGVGLILAVPWAYVLAVLLPARFIVGFAQTLGADGAGSLAFGPFGHVVVLVQAVIAVVVIFHLVEGDRPNLIYRRRFRSYSAERAAADAEREDGT